MKIIFTPEDPENYTELDLWEINLLLTGYQGVCHCDSSVYCPSKGDDDAWRIYCGRCAAVLVAPRPVYWVISDLNRSGEALRDVACSEWERKGFDLDYHLAKELWCTTSLDFVNWCVDKGFSRIPYASWTALETDKEAILGEILVSIKHAI